VTGKQPFAALLMVSICQILEEGVHRPCRLLEQQHIQLAFRKYLVHNMIYIMFNTCEAAADLDPVEQRFCTCLHTHWAKITGRSWAGHQGIGSQFLAEARDFSSSKHPDQLREPPTILFSGYQESLSLEGKTGQGTKLPSQSVVKVKNVWI